VEVVERLSRLNPFRGTFGRMEGVTTAIVAFIFVCLIFPKLIKTKPQYYAALVAVLAIIFLDAVGHFSSAPSFRVFVYVMTALLQILAIVVLILAAGGLTLRDLGGELAGAYEVIRRGDDKTVIVPIGSQAAKSKEDEGRVVYEIDPATAEELRRKAAEQQKANPPGDSSLPLE
jgi:hypothetical protein